MSYSNFYARVYAGRRQATQALKAVFSFRASKIYLIVILTLQIIVWVQAILIKYNFTGDFLVLHYNVDFGIDLVGNPSKIFFYPFIGLLISLFNLILAAKFSGNKDFKFLAHLLLGSAALFGLYLISSLFSIYLINFR